MANSSGAKWKQNLGRMNHSRLLPFLRALRSTFSAGNWKGIFRTDTPKQYNLMFSQERGKLPYGLRLQQRKILMDFVYSWEAMNSQSVDSEVCMSVFSFAFELSLSSFTSSLSPGLSLDPDLGSAVQERHGDQQSAMKMIKGLELLWGEEAEMSQRDKYLTGGSREDRARLLSVVLSDRTRSKEQKSKHKKFHLNITKIFSFAVRMAKLLKRLHREAVESPSWEIPTLALSNCFSWCCSEWGVDWMIPRDAFQPQSLYDPVGASSSTTNYGAN